MSEGEASGEMEAIQIRLDLRAEFTVKGFVSAASLWELGKAQLPSE